jgi:hypothetical protein
VLKTKNFVNNVNIKDRGELDHPLVFENFTEYKSPAFYDCPRPS